MAYSLLTMSEVKQLLNREATQANILIRAKYDYSKLELKLSRLIISTIKPNEKPKDRIIIPRDQMVRFFSTSGAKQGRLYKDLKETIFSLNQKPIEIRTDTQKATIYWIGAHGVNLETGDYWFDIPKAMQPFLFALKGNFTSIPLYIYDKFRSPYPARMYEILYSYRHMKGGLVIYKTWQELQEQLGASHTEYSNFKHRILKKCQQLLEEHTNLRFEFKEIKEQGSRKVVGLKIWVYIQKKIKVELNKENTLFPAISDQEQSQQKEIINSIETTLLGWGVNFKTVKECLLDPFSFIEDQNELEKAKEQFKDNKIEFIWDKLEYTNQAQNIKDEASFFLAAIKNNYQNKAKRKKLEKVKKVEAVSKKNQEKIKLEQERQRLNKSYYRSFFTIMETLFIKEPVYYKYAIEETRKKPFSLYKQELTLEENMSDGKIFRLNVLAFIQKDRPEEFGGLIEEFEEKIKQIEDQLKKLLTLKM